MNSTMFRKGAPIGRFLGLLAIALTAGFFLSGCAEMRQYSINSWQGPMPMNDVRYVQSGI
jgi:hypothetical protein